jgi:predicted RNase H-like HicB family nuclease
MGLVSMLYPVYIHLGDNNHAHGATVPDFPGCFSAADDWQGLPKAVQEALEVWCEGEKGDLPAPTPLEVLATHAEYQGGVWMLLDVDTDKLDTTPVRLNISLPQSLVNEIDAYAKAHGATRSGFLAMAAREVMSNG